MLVILCARLNILHTFDYSKVLNRLQLKLVISFVLKTSAFTLSFSYVRRIFFFFQAEDGIRDTSVTGVQTCALPIFVTMVSFGLGLQRNTVARFKELDLFNEITVFGKNLNSIIEAGFNKRPGGANDKDRKSVV